MRRHLIATAALTLGLVALVATTGQAQEAPPSSTITSTSVPLGPPVTLTLDQFVPPELAPAGRNDEQPNTPPAAAPDEGSGGLLRGPDLRGGQNPTLYENYGTAGYGLDSDYGVSDSGDGLKNFAASIPWSAVVWIADLSAKLLQWSFSINVFDLAGDSVNQVAGALEHTVYRPFLVAFLVLVGAHLVWQGVIRRRGSVVGETSVWVVAALVGGGLFLANPAAITNGLNRATSGVARTILTGVAVVDLKAGPDDGVTTRGSFGGDPADTQLRVSADRFMRIFVYKPWLAMEFGDAEKGERWGERLLKAKSLNLAEAERARDDPAYRKRINAEKKDAYREVADEIHQDPQAMEWFHGHRAGERVGLAAMSLVAVMVAGGILMILALAVLLAQLAMLMLAMLAPIFLLAGVQPGPGRVLATRWLGLLLGAAFKRVAYA
ncbi:MAG: type IV secretion system protein, partial [Acidimicrobiia bacterium]